MLLHRRLLMLSSTGAQNLQSTITLEKRKHSTRMALSGIVSISSEETVFRGLQSEVHLDGSQGGGIVTVPFEVLKGVRETPITVILQTRTIKKTVTIYASTKDLEPRTNGNYEVALQKYFFQSHSECGITPEVTPIDVSNGTTQVIVSNSTIEDVEFPSVDEILNGRYSSLKSKTLRLDNISLNRLTARKTDKFVSKSNRYFVTIRRKEKGHIIFYVSGAGNKNVTLKSISDPRLPAKVMTVANNYAAFKYTTVGPNGEEEFLDVDNILVKVQNDQNEKLFFYLSMSCLSN
eukprot:NP_509559.1 Uncharacterized protein CELE_F18G5.5 [Caenorhabditis elegans]